MEVKRFYQILKKHFEKDYISNFHGIIITPYYKDNNNSIEFAYTNPKNLSFNYSCLNDYVYEQSKLMSILVGISESVYSSDIDKYITLKYPKNKNYIHFSKEDKQKIIDILKSITHFDFDSDGIDIESDMKFVETDIRGGDDYIDINTVFEFKNIKNKNRQYDYDTNVEYLRNWVYDDFKNYYEVSTRILSPIINFIQDNPLLFNSEFMYFNPNITPIAFKSDGTQIEI